MASNPGTTREMTIVLLGFKRAGKSSSGNAILCREEFEIGETTQCVKRQGQVAGRQVTVVDTPGWWMNLPIEYTPELVKQEIVLSASLCPPGPQTVLLVTRLDLSFKEKEKVSVEGHMKLLGKGVWIHAILLFTYGDYLQDTTIEQHIKSEGEALQWLVEKCGNRYHVFNNENSGDGTQTTELLEKIKKMVAGNRGRHYEIDRQLSQAVEEKRRTEKERARNRLMMVQKQMETLSSLDGDSLHLSELRIVLLGYKESGKSSTGNTILGREEFDSKNTTTDSVVGQGKVAGRQVIVVDTPGWWQHHHNQMKIKHEITRCMFICPRRPLTLLLVIRLDVSFPEFRATVGEHLRLFGKGVWRHTIVLFTHGDCLGDTTIEQYIESEGEALQWLVEKCGNRYHVFNNENRVDDTQVTELLEKIKEMVTVLSLEF